MKLTGKWIWKSSEHKDYHPSKLFFHSVHTEWQWACLHAQVAFTRIKFAKAEPSLTQNSILSLLTNMSCTELGAFSPHTLFHQESTLAQTKPITNSHTASYLFQAHSSPLDQGLQPSNSFILLEELVGVQRGACDVPIPLVRDKLRGPKPLQLGGTLTAMKVPFRRNAKCHENLRDFLDKLQFVGKLRQVLWQLNEVVVNVHEAEISLAVKTWWGVWTTPEH